MVSQSAQQLPPHTNTCQVVSESLRAFCNTSPQTIITFHTYAYPVRNPWFHHIACIYFNWCNLCTCTVNLQRNLFWLFFVLLILRLSSATGSGTGCRQLQLWLAHCSNWVSAKCFMIGGLLNSLSVTGKHCFTSVYFHGWLELGSWFF